MANSYLTGGIATTDSVVSNFNRDPELAFNAVLDNLEYPMLQVALGNGLGIMASMTNTSIEWSDVYAPTQETALTADTTADATSLTFGTTNIKKIVPNTILLIDDEYILVTAVDTDAGTATVTRAFSGSTGAIHTTTDTVYILAQTPLEIESAGSAFAEFGSTTTNYVQVFERDVVVSDVSQAINFKTPEQQAAYQVARKSQEIWQMVASSAWRGSSTSGARKTMAGFRELCTTNSDASVGALTFADIDDAVVTCRKNGAAPDTLFVSPTVKGYMAQWGDRIGTRQNNGPLTVAGGSVETFISSTGRPLDIVLDDTLDSDEAFLVPRANMLGGWVPILPMEETLHGMAGMGGIRIEKLGRDGAYSKYQLLAASCVGLLAEQTAFKFAGITSADADGVA